MTYVEEVDVTALEELREQLNKKWRSERGHLTMLPFLMRAIVRTLPEFPQINARYDDGAGPVVMRRRSRAPGGSRAHWQGRARGAVGVDDHDHEPGPLGGIVTTPVINYPEVAIVGVNKIVERPMVRNGAVVPRLMMNLSASFDHRIVDGLRAASFVQAVRAGLEVPAALFIE